MFADAWTQPRGFPPKIFQALVACCREKRNKINLSSKSWNMSGNSVLKHVRKFLQYDFGVVEAIGATVFVGLSVSSSAFLGKATWCPSDFVGVFFLGGLLPALGPWKLGWNCSTYAIHQVTIQVGYQVTNQFWARLYAAMHDRISDFSIALLVCFVWPGYFHAPGRSRAEKLHHALLDSNFEKKLWRLRRLPIPLDDSEVESLDSLDLGRHQIAKDSLRRHGCWNGFWDSISYGIKQLPQTQIQISKLDTIIWFGSLLLVEFFSKIFFKLRFQSQLCEGAVTTVAACAFLLPCRMILFRPFGVKNERSTESINSCKSCCDIHVTDIPFAVRSIWGKLGWTLLLNATISIVYTFSFLAPLLLIAGPLSAPRSCCGVSRGHKMNSAVAPDSWLARRCHAKMRFDYLMLIVQYCTYS